MNRSPHRVSRPATKRLDPAAVSTRVTAQGRRVFTVAGRSVGQGVLLVCLATACEGSDANVLAGPGGRAGEAGSATAPGGAGPGASAGANGMVGGSAQGGSATGGASASAGATGVQLTNDDVTISTVSLGPALLTNEDEAGLHPVVLAPLPDGGSRLGWMSNDGNLHITSLDAEGKAKGAEITLPAHDFSDLYADAQGGVALLTRDAQGGGEKNCGEPTHLCGAPPSPPIPCHDMYLVRFDATGETWATKVTSSSAELPPYSTSKTGPTAFMIWWYAHHGRIATDGARFAAYFGDAISVSEGGCINIHQGDRMKIVDGTGTLVAGGFDLGCSHSGFERIVWDPRSSSFVSICKTDNANRIAFAPTYKTIRPVALGYSDFGDFVLDSPGEGYWATVSDIRPGQPGDADGLADVHLLHFTTGEADRDLIVTTGQARNERAPHIARFGDNHLLVVWETSTSMGTLQPGDKSRTLHAQVRLRQDGSAVGAPLTIDARGNRFQSLATYPNGDVAFVAAGTSPGDVRVVRIAAPLARRSRGDHADAWAPRSGTCERLSRTRRTSRLTFCAACLPPSSPHE